MKATCHLETFFSWLNMFSLGVNNCLFFLIFDWGFSNSSRSSKFGDYATVTVAGRILFQSRKHVLTDLSVFWEHFYSSLFTFYHCQNRSLHSLPSNNANISSHKFGGFSGLNVEIFFPNSIPSRCFYGRIYSLASTSCLHTWVFFSPTLSDHFFLFCVAFPFCWCLLPPVFHIECRRIIWKSRIFEAFKNPQLNHTWKSILSCQVT